MSQMRCYVEVRNIKIRNTHGAGIQIEMVRAVRNARAQTVYTRPGMNGEHYQVFEWMKEF
jgi:phage replication-related protein YjqB (UPF0714/DUF867 family)